MKGNSMNILQPLSVFSVFITLKPPRFKNTSYCFIVLFCLALDSVSLAFTFLSVIIKFLTDHKDIL